MSGRVARRATVPVVSGTQKNLMVLAGLSIFPARISAVRVRAISRSRPLPEALSFALGLGWHRCAMRNISSSGLEDPSDGRRDHIVLAGQQLGVHVRPEDDLLTACQILPEPVPLALAQGEPEPDLLLVVRCGPYALVAAGVRDVSTLADLGELVRERVRDHSRRSPLHDSLDVNGMGLAPGEHYLALDVLSPVVLR